MIFYSQKMCTKKAFERTLLRNKQKNRTFFSGDLIFKTRDHSTEKMSISCGVRDMNFKWNLQ